MLRSIQSACIFCESKWSQTALPWAGAGQMRLVTRLAQRRRPSRMKLSGDVAKTKVKNTSRDPKAKRKTNNTLSGPFASMNQTVARVRDQLPGSARPEQQVRYSRDKSYSGKADVKHGRQDYKALKMQQSLSHVGYAVRNKIKGQISEVETFEQFSLLPDLQKSIIPQALNGLEGATPTPVQKLAIPALMGTRSGRRRGRMSEEKVEGMEQFLVAAETGSGKTLAYMIPVVDSMKRAEAEEAAAAAIAKEKESTKNSNMLELEPDEWADDGSVAAQPRAIILVPTSELVDQVGAVAKSLSHAVKFRASLLSSAYSHTVIRNRLHAPNGIDMLICTPQLLFSISQSNPYVLSRVSHLVIDEADSLFDRSFEEFTTAIVDRTSPSLKQLIMCSATIPKRMDNYLRENYPDIRRLTTPNLHAIPRRVQLGVVDVDGTNYHGNRDLACADTIWTIGRTSQEFFDERFANVAEKSPIKRILVFANEREKTVELASYLQSKGIDAVALNRDTAIRQVTDVLGQFTGSTIGESSGSKSDDKGQTNGNEKAMVKKLPNTKVLVVTDLASRGIDTTLVRHVILYDVPHTSIDFIHRLGRTGRMGRRGRGIVLVGKKDRKDIVREVREGMFRGQALI